MYPIKYKILENKFPTGISTSILNKDTGVICPKCIGNKEYVQFIKDVVKYGVVIVEGSTVGVTTAYNIVREAEYPSIEDQLDKIYHSGVNAWKADIKVIKDKYPKTQVGVTTIASLPSWLDTAIYDKQTENYLNAVERLKRYRLVDGKAAVTVQTVIGTENVWDAGIGKTVTRDVYKTSINEPAIVGIAATDNRVINDEAERREAEDTISRTPQSIIDANS